MQKPKNIYHFTRSETAIRKILPDRPELLMNNVSKMNDPTENLTYISNTNESIINPFKNYYLSLDTIVIAERIRNESKVLCFSVDKAVENPNQLIEGYQLQRMWAQYGDNNSGICIVIDYEKFIKENSAIIDKYGIIDDYVEYKGHNFQRIPTPLYGVSNDNLEKHNSKCLCEHWKDYQKDSNFIKQRFFSKNIDWAGESEFRFLAFSNENEEIMLSLKNSIIQIILGFNFSKHFLASLIQYVDKDKVYCLRMEMNGEFGLRKI